MTRARPDRPTTIRIVWNPPTPAQARNLIAAMDRFLTAQAAEKETARR